jgi:hypothetical protein
MRLQDGDEISFGGQPDADILDSPNPEFYNLKLAVARATYACGASEMVDKMCAEHDDDEDEAIESFPVYLGRPYVADDALFRRLDNRLSFC